MALAKCSLCGVMYADDDRSSCYYHPGDHRGNPQIGVALGGLSGWSCCKNMARDARGCRLAATHTPCPTTAAALARFPQSADRPAARTDAEPPPVAVVEGVPLGLITHTVTVGESVGTIALKYGMRRDQLVKWNKLLTPSVAPGQVLKVTPPPAGEKREPELAQKLRTFQRRTGSDSVEEARYYVDSADGDVEAAVQAFEADGAAMTGAAGGRSQAGKKDDCCIS